MTSPATPLEVLRRMDGLLDSPEKWTKGVVIGLSPCCLLSAINRVGGEDHYQDVRRRILDITRTGSVANWNDAPERTFPEVKAALALAIKLAEEEGHE